jgi:hypothetical protein
MHKQHPMQLKQSSRRETSSKAANHRIHMLGVVRQRTPLNKPSADTQLWLHQNFTVI